MSSQEYYNLIIKFDPAVCVSNFCLFESASSHSGNTGSSMSVSSPSSPPSWRPLSTSPTSAARKSVM